MKRIVFILAGIVMTVGVGGFLFYASFMNRSLTDVSPEAEARRARQVAAQNENAFPQPVAKLRTIQPPNQMKNLYFGDLHVHTDLSFDAYLFGTRLSPEDAYRFANGEPIKNAAGEKMQLARPLDFVALTDHAESFGLFETCGQDDLSAAVRAACALFDKPSPSYFLELRAAGTQRPLQRPLDTCVTEENCLEMAKTTWSKVVAAANRHNKPGEFSAFAAYEYSPVLSGNGKHHRNVIFRGGRVPDHAISAFDAPTAIDLWHTLDQTCTDGCEVLTIPHNMNKTWGLAYNDLTIDGDVYMPDDWKIRGKLERLAEIMQIKGASECAVGVGTADEECDFEQYFPPCAEDQTTKCIHPTSMARDGLKIGLVLEKDLGFNPLQFGFIGSTDTHNSNPGDTEEWDYRGAAGTIDGPAKVRHDNNKRGTPRQIERNPGGLAAVWAQENTREAIFDGLRARESYATSGTRIALRFFASWGFSGGILDAPDLIPQAYRDGAPMGTVLTAQAASPQFLIWAAMDPDGGPLQKVQIVKGWMTDDGPQEKVVDVVCASGTSPDPATGRCPASDAGVNLSDCSLIGTSGNAQLMTLWTDTAYDPAASAFYYVRVLQDPTCRYSTYDALRLGEMPPDGLPQTVQERAWSSPIWIRPE